MSITRYTLMFLLFTTMYSFAMENSSQSSEDLYLALHNKRSSLGGSFEIHRNLRASLDWIRTLTYSKNQRQNKKFCEKVIEKGFSKVPIEFLDILNHVRNHATDFQEKTAKEVEAAYNYIRKTSNFFSEDATQMYLAENNLSSDNFFKKISQNPEVLTVYKTIKEKKDPTNNVTFTKTSIAYFYELIASHGIKFPQPTSDGTYSMPQFLELNETNPTIHSDANYEKMEQLIRASFIVTLTLESLHENNIDTEKQFTKLNEALEKSTKEIWDSQPKSECIIL